MITQVRAVLCLIGALLLPMTAHAETLDLSNPEDALKATRKVQCSLQDAVPTVLSWSGKVYSHIQGVADQHLFNTEAFSIRNCKTYEDDTRGYGFRIIAREIVLFLDPETNEILRTWDNPWTGEELEVMHIANDPMSLPFPFYALSKDGKPHRFEGTLLDDLVSITSEKVLFYENPLGGPYQDFVGGQYHAFELFQFFMPTDELLNATNDEVMTLSMSNARVGPWMPWMKMGGRTGQLIFQGAGRKIESFDNLSDRLKTEVRTNYPRFENPPALDDFRPMANSWVGFKNEMESRAKETAEEDTP